MSLLTKLLLLMTVLTLGAAAPAAADRGKGKVSYSGQGTVAEVDVEAGTMLVTFTSTNRAMNGLLDGHLAGVTVRVGDRTRLSVDGDRGDLEFLCPGDTVSVKFVSRKRLHRVPATAADKVSVSTFDGDCPDPETAGL